jgi:glycosyltransferase involved in cell wall biosynthesis
MKILFFSPTKIDPGRGAVRVLMGLSAALEKLGCECTLLGPPDLGTDPSNCPPVLHEYLLHHAEEFDVIDFDYKCLHLDRRALSERPVFVARAQLLRHNWVHSPNPPVRHWRAGLRVLQFQSRRVHHWRQLARDEQTYRQADLVAVLNRRDKQTLTERGVPPDRVAVFPGGLDQEQHAAFASNVPSRPPEAPVVAFVGEFGLRKGLADFPDIVRRVAKAVPAVRFRLLGTGHSATYVFRHFPKRLWEHLEVTPTFEPGRLPDLLAGATVGVFPSYAEGFGLGVLEMLAAGLPVIAYDVPGPTEMLLPAHVVPVKDTRGLSEKVIRLLQDRDGWEQHHRWARTRASDFTWDAVAADAYRVYRSALAGEGSR